MIYIFLNHPLKTHTESKHTDSEWTHFEWTHRTVYTQWYSMHHFGSSCNAHANKRFWSEPNAHIDLSFDLQAEWTRSDWHVNITYIYCHNIKNMVLLDHCHFISSNWRPNTESCGLKAITTFHVSQNSQNLYKALGLPTLARSRIVCCYSSLC